MKKEDDAASKDRLAKLEQELANLKEDRDRLASHWQSEKDAIGRSRKLKGELEQMRLAVEATAQGFDDVVATNSALLTILPLVKRLGIRTTSTIGMTLATIGMLLLTTSDRDGSYLSDVLLGLGPVSVAP